MERARGERQEPALEIRLLRHADLRSVLSLERSVYPAPWRIEHFAQVIDLPGGMGWVAVGPTGEIVGYAVGWVAADEAELANIAVATGWRRRGVGRRLVDSVRQAACELGARRLYLEVRASNLAAQSFYAGLGFEVVGRRPGYYARPREDALVMAVDLIESGT